jgi:hypothetical protein
LNGAACSISAKYPDRDKLQQRSEMTGCANKRHPRSELKALPIKYEGEYITPP